jgi:hypothetical protein
MLSESTHSFFATKHVTTTTVITHPTSVAHAKVQALKRSVVTVVLADAESKLRNSGLAIPHKV